MNERYKSIFDALKILIEVDKDLIETQPKEEYINHKLAQYLEAVLKNKNLLGACSMDMEYNKYKEDEKKISNYRNIRPDIIAHERRSGNNNNLIAIEAKKGYGDKDDRKKIIDLLCNEAYKYSIGAVISYLPQKNYLKIIFYEESGWRRYLMCKNSYKITETKR